MALLGIRVALGCRSWMDVLGLLGYEVWGGGGGGALGPEVREP